MVDVLGMHILKHEEFEETSTSLINGPWNTIWSKTMIGYGEESDAFVFEVIYNYGKHKYELGNDSKFFGLAETDISFRALHRGIEVKIDKYGECLEDPTGYKWILVPGETTKPQVYYVALNCSDVKRSIEFYCTFFGMEKHEPNGVYFPGNDFYIQFWQSNKPIDHKETGSRLWIGVEDLRLARNSFSKENIRHELQDDGAIELFVAIDPDGYEVCVVKTKSYLELSKARKGDALIDWNKRKQKLDRYQAALPIQS